MARTVSLAALQGALSAETDEIYLVLLEIDHTSLGTPIRFVNNSTNVTSGGNVYTAYPFETNMPEDVDEREPVAEIRVDNVSRDLIDELRSIIDPLDVTLSVVTEGTPNTIEWGPLAMRSSGASYDANVITIRLAYSAFTREPFPYLKFDNVNFPGMFS